LISVETSRDEISPPVRRATFIGSATLEEGAEVLRDETKLAALASRPFLGPAIRTSTSPSAGVT